MFFFFNSFVSRVHTWSGTEHIKLNKEMIEKYLKKECEIEQEQIFHGVLLYPKFSVIGKSFKIVIFMGSRWPMPLLVLVLSMCIFFDPVARTQPVSSGKAYVYQGTWYNLQLVIKVGLLYTVQFSNINLEIP